MENPRDQRSMQAFQSFLVAVKRSMIYLLKYTLVPETHTDNHKTGISPNSKIIRIAKLYCTNSLYCLCCEICCYCENWLKLYNSVVNCEILFELRNLVKIVNLFI